MNFTDTQLQACFELRLAEQSSGIPSELRQVGALIATQDWFQMTEGRHSSRVHETIESLLSPGLRPRLREWYRRPGLQLGGAAVAFRDHLSRLAGERFEHGKAPLKPS